MLREAARRLWLLFSRLEVIGFIKKDWIDFFEVDEFEDIHALGGFDVGALEVLVFEHDEFAFFVFVAFDDLVPGHFFAVGFGDALIIDRAEVVSSGAGGISIPPLRVAGKARWEY